MRTGASRFGSKRRYLGFLDLSVHLGKKLNFKKPVRDFNKEGGKRIDVCGIRLADRGF